MFEESKVREYRVGYGDTLAIISNKFYGKPDFALVIYEHNRHEIATPNQIFPGQKLAIPYIPLNAAVYG